MCHDVVAICSLSFSVVLTAKKKQSRTLWGLQQRKTSNLICQAGENSSFLFPAPVSTQPAPPALKGRLVSLIFLHRDIKVNYTLSSQLSSCGLSTTYLATKVRLLKQYILHDLCKNAENSSSRQCIFINRFFHDCKPRSCIISMRLLHFEKLIKKPGICGKKKHNNCNQGKAGAAPALQGSSSLQGSQPQSLRDLLGHKLLLISHGAYSILRNEL